MFFNILNHEIILFSYHYYSLYKENGLSGLYVGSAARVSWLLPFTTIYLGVYEVTKRTLLQRKIDEYIRKHNQINKKI
jgi:hypothetical protein